MAVASTARAAVGPVAAGQVGAIDLRCAGSLAPKRGAVIRVVAQGVATRSRIVTSRRARPRASRRPQLARRGRGSSVCSIGNDAALGRRQRHPRVPQRGLAGSRCRPSSAGCARSGARPGRRPPPPWGERPARRQRVCRDRPLGAASRPRPATREPSATRATPIGVVAGSSHRGRALSTKSVAGSLTRAPNSAPRAHARTPRGRVVGRRGAERAAVVLRGVDVGGGPRVVDDYVLRLGLVGADDRLGACGGVGAAERGEQRAAEDDRMAVAGAAGTGRPMVRPPDVEAYRRACLRRR